MMTTYEIIEHPVTREYIDLYRANDKNFYTTFLVINPDTNELDIVECDEVRRPDWYTIHWFDTDTCMTQKYEEDLAGYIDNYESVIVRTASNVYDAIDDFVNMYNDEISALMNTE